MMERWRGGGGDANNVHNDEGQQHFAFTVQYMNVHYFV